MSKLEKLWYTLAGWLPYKLRYFVIIRASTDATTGEWSYVEVPGVTITELLERMK
jgi:hypothetical protein